MGKKYIDVPLRSKSEETDFFCKDGEIESVSGVRFKMCDSGESEEPEVSYREGSGNDTAPVPDVDFALVRDVLPGWHVNYDQFPVKTIIASEPSMEYWNSMGAQLLSQFVTEASSQDLYVSPFYVMGAWKGVDGRYICHSDPVMLIPNSKIPLVATDGDTGSTELEMKIAGAVCSLYFRMRAPEVLRDWVGRIASLEILVSEPLYKYDTYHAFIPSKHVNSDNHCVSLDPTTGEIAGRLVCSETLKLAWKWNVEYRIHNTELRMNQIPNGMKFYPVGSVTLGDVDLKGEWEKVSGKEYTSGSMVYGAGETGRSDSNLMVVGKGEGISLLTRPIKLGSAGELKHLRRVRLRGNYDSNKLEFRIEGSHDMLEWWCIARRKGSVVALGCHGFRFYRIRITGKLEEGENLQGVSIEMF